MSYSMCNIWSIKGFSKALPLLLAILQVSIVTRSIISGLDLNRLTEREAEDFIWKWSCLGNERKNVQ